MTRFPAAHLKSEDDRPDQTEGEARVSVDNVLGTDRLQPDLETRTTGSGSSPTNF